MGGELYIYIGYIIVYYTYAFVLMASKRGIERREASDIGEGRREASERGQRVGICILIR